ncbi:MAG: M16 family metallopeptidase [Candidatus Scalinduaceae bacterium]
MYKYSKEVLANGLRVIYIEIPHIHSVVIASYVGMGSRFENNEQLGISHFLEHMLFRGTRRFENSYELFKSIDDIGGDIDAYTAPEYSAVTIQVLNKYLENGLKILSDILLGGNFNVNDIETERLILKEEIGQFKDAKGDYICIDDISYNLMWKENSIDIASIGDEKTLSAITKDELTTHYKKFFVPENVVICISGNFKKDKTSNFVRKIYDNFQGKYKVKKPPITNKQTSPRHVFKKSPAHMISLKLCHKAYPYKHKNVVIVLIITDILGGGISSRLVSNIREKLGLVYEISSYPTMFSDVGSIDIYTSTHTNNFSKTLTAVMDEINKLLRNGISDEDLKRTEERVFSQMQLIMDGPLAMVNWFGVEELLLCPQIPETPENLAEKVRNVKREQVYQVMKEIFVPEKRNLIVIGPCKWKDKRKAIRTLT